jgi:hypothetical protein
MHFSLEALAARLSRAGMPMAGETLLRAAELLRMRDADLDRMTDLYLMTVCVGAYRRPESDLPAWV